MNDQTTKAPAADILAGHTVHGFDRDLAKLRTLILEMGERVVEQTHTAINALLGGDLSPAYRVLDREPQIDYMALDADDEAFRVIVRRQPTAVDLRIILALSKIADEAERSGDKAARIAHRAIGLRRTELRVDAELERLLRKLECLVCQAFEQAMGGVAQFDTRQALKVFEDESAMTEANDALVRHLTTRGEDPYPAAQLEPLFAIAHALHRIGNHAGAIAEHVIYVALGEDVRFRNREILIETLRSRDNGKVNAD